MSLTQVSWEAFVAGIIKLTPVAFYFVLTSAWTLLVFWCGRRSGWHRGVKDAPDVVKYEVLEARHRALVAEERLTTEKKVSRRYEVILGQLGQNLGESRVMNFPIEVNSQLPKGTVAIYDLERRRVVGKIVNVDDGTSKFKKAPS